MQNWELKGMEVLKMRVIGWKICLEYYFRKRLAIHHLNVSGLPSDKNRKVRKARSV
jgi:hypothetical protein